MSDDALESIPALQDKHRRVLAELGITTSDALAHADRAAILEAMRRQRPPPTAEDIDGWQEHARRHLGAVSNASEWDQVAQFAISFEQRRDGQAGQKRLVVEQT